VKNETCSGHIVPNVSLRIGRTSLRANRGSTALGSPESKLTRDIAGPARGMQTDRMLGPSRHVIEMPQKGSTTELTRANEAMRKRTKDEQGHGKSTVVTVTLRWEPHNLILQIKDNGSGIPTTCLVKSEGIGLRSIRERAAQIGANLVIQTGPCVGQG
jgi:hypothetical protein